MCQVFISLQDHLHLFMHFVFSFMGHFYEWPYIRNSHNNLCYYMPLCISIAIPYMHVLLHAGKLNHAWKPRYVVPSYSQYWPCFYNTESSLQPILFQFVLSVHLFFCSSVCPLMDDWMNRWIGVHTEFPCILQDIVYLGAAA